MHLANQSITNTSVYSHQLQCMYKVHKSIDLEPSHIENCQSTLAVAQVYQIQANVGK